jgi:hypothetical protein
MEPDRENIENRIGIYPFNMHIKRNMNTDIHIGVLSNTNSDIHIGVFIKYEFRYLDIRIHP